MSIIETFEQEKLQKLKEFKMWLHTAEQTDKSAVAINFQFKHPKFRTESFAKLDLEDPYIMNRLSRVLSDELTNIIVEKQCKH